MGALKDSTMRVEAWPRRGKVGGLLLEGGATAEAAAWAGVGEGGAWGAGVDESLGVPWGAGVDESAGEGGVGEGERMVTRSLGERPCKAVRRVGWEEEEKASRKDRGEGEVLVRVRAHFTASFTRVSGSSKCFKPRGPRGAARAWEVAATVAAAAAALSSSFLCTEPEEEGLLPLPAEFPVPGRDAGAPFFPAS